MFLCPEISSAEQNHLHLIKMPYDIHPTYSPKGASLATRAIAGAKPWPGTHYSAPTGALVGARRASSFTPRIHLVKVELEFYQILIT